MGARLFKATNKLKIIDPKNKERILVVGDLHGDFESFQKIQKIFNPNKDLLIFLGDYADRGNKGIEVIESINKLFEKYKDEVVALKGNHEDYRNGMPFFSPCNLIEEAELKRGGWKNYYESFLKDFFNKLYIAAVFQKILFVHGGISSRINSLEDLKHPTPEVEEDVLWSDPYEEIGEIPSFRGAGVLFGENISEKVCNSLGINFIIRSHEPMKAIVDPYVEHKGRIVTISSTKVYGGNPFILGLPINNLPENGYEVIKYKISLV